ncbi:MAG: DUF4245 domain-containing protein [Nocardioidaceae bacterium]
MSQAKSSYRRSANGLIGALIAVLLTIAFVWGLTWFQRRSTPNPAATVSYASSLQVARQLAGFQVLAPTPKPTWWRCTSVAYTPGTHHDTSWHLGGLTTDGQYIGLEQGIESPGVFIPANTAANQPRSPVTIDGAEWTRLASGQGETALVHERGKVTTIVTGTAPLSQLETFAAALK